VADIYMTDVHIVTDVVTYALEAHRHTMHVPDHWLDYQCIQQQRLQHIFTIMIVSKESWHS
jgi:hypothetical protein